MSAPPPPPPTAAAPAPPGAPAAEAPAQPPQPEMPDPGSFDMLAMDAKSVFVLPHQFFDGAKVSMLKALSDNVQVQHTLEMGSMTEPSSYHFAPTYVGKDSSPVLAGDINTEGLLMGQTVFNISPAVAFKMQAQADREKVYGAQAEINYNGSVSTTVAKIINFNPAKESAIVTLSYLQKVTKRLALGAEYTYQATPMIEGSGVVVGGRYKTDDWSATALVSPANGVLQATYFAKLSKQCQVASELNVDLGQQEAVASLGYQYNFDTASFRGQIRSNGQVAGVLEMQINPISSFTLTGMIDHFSGKSRFGFGFTIAGGAAPPEGQQPQ